MATISRGQTFGVSEQVTNTKLHNLVDDATITAIVNNDIDNSAAIDDLKLAAITRSNKVSGTALFNIASLPTSAGLVPYANLSFSSFPAVNASYVSGSSLFNLSSLPTLAGQIPYRNIVSSLASGAYPQYNGSSFVGAVPISSTLYLNGTTYTEASATTSRTTTSLTFAKIKEFSPLVRQGNITVQWTTSKDPDGDGEHTRLYVNDIAVGEDKFRGGGAGEVVETESNVSVNAGDVVQIYAHATNPGTTVTVKNVYIKTLNPTTVQEVSSY